MVTSRTACISGMGSTNCQVAPTPQNHNASPSFRTWAMPSLRDLRSSMRKARSIGCWWYATACLRAGQLGGGFPGPEAKGRSSRSSKGPEDTRKRLHDRRDLSGEDHDRSPEAYRLRTVKGPSADVPVRVVELLQLRDSFESRRKQVDVGVRSKAQNRLLFRNQTISELGNVYLPLAQVVNNRFVEFP